MIRVFEEFHANGRLARGCNPSFIALTPKKEGAVTLDEFRPISMIGSLYKIIAKLLAGRLRKVMDEIISENQSAFVQGRFILDSAVILNVIIEDARKNRKSSLSFKVDFAKAYDSMDWDFLDDMLAQFNFPNKWMRWIKECVTSATANVLVNGSPSGEFKLERGIRQGDPFLLFFFLLWLKGWV